VIILDCLIYRTAGPCWDIDEIYREMGCANEPLIVLSAQHWDSEETYHRDFSAQFADTERLAADFAEKGRMIVVRDIHPAARDSVTYMCIALLSIYQRPLDLGTPHPKFVIILEKWPFDSVGITLDGKDLVCYQCVGGVGSFGFSEIRSSISAISGVQTASAFSSASSC